MKVGYQVLGIALTLHATAAADSWISGRQFIDQADTSGNSGSLAVRALDRDTQVSSFPGMTLSPTGDLWIKQFETAMSLDQSDFNSHSFSLFINPLGDFNSNPENGTFYTFSVANPGSFSYRNYSTTGSTDPNQILTFTFDSPVHLSAGQTWVLSPVMNLNQGESGSYAANATQLAASPSATQDRLWTSYSGAEQAARPWAMDALVTGSATVVPEPGTFALLAAGASILFGLRARSRRTA